MIITEKKLVMACAALSLIGIAALFVISTITEPPAISVFEASGSTGKARISGILTSVQILEGRAEMKVAGYEAIHAVSFDNELVSKLGLHKFQEVEVTGELTQYKGTRSIIVSKIKPLGSVCNLTEAESIG